jgi:hypothetical protein
VVLMTSNLTSSMYDTQLALVCEGPGHPQVSSLCPS